MSNYEDLQRGLKFSEEVAVTTAVAPLAGVGQVHLLIAIVATISSVAVIITITIVVKLTIKGCPSTNNGRQILEETQTTVCSNPLQTGNYVAAERYDLEAISPQFNPSHVDLATGENIAETSMVPLLENPASTPRTETGPSEQPRPILPAVQIHAAPLSAPETSTPRPGLVFNGTASFSPIKGKNLSF